MTSPQTDQVLGVKSGAIPKPLPWFMLGLLFVAMVIAYVERGNMSYAAPFLANEFQLTATLKGYVFSAFLFGYSLMQIPAGKLVDRFGDKLAYAFFFVAWCLVAASLGLAQAAWQLLLLHALLGVAESVSGPASVAFIARHFPESRRGFATGIFLAGTKIGPAVGALLATYLIARVGWRGLFVLCGLAPMVWVLFWLWGYRSVDQREPQLLGSDNQSRLPIAPRVSLGELMQHAPVWGVYLGYFCYGFLWYMLINWLPSFLMEQMKCSLNDTGWWAAFNYGGIAFSAIACGWLADRLIQRGFSKKRVRKSFIVAGFLFGALVVFVPMLKDRPAVLYLLLVSCCGMGLATANTWTVTQSLAPAGAIGTLSGIQNFGATSGGFLAPMVMGWLKDATGSYNAGFVCAGVLMALGVFSYLVLIKELEPLKLKNS